MRRIVDILIAAGIQGFQGFQSECGVLLADMVEKRTRDGEPLLIFGPISVTTELPELTAAQIESRVRQAVETARGKASLVLFTANTINPDIPTENVVALSRAVGATIALPAT